MTAKHTNGIINEVDISDESDSHACTGVISAPPSIAIIRPDAAIFAESGSTFSRAMPYIVGNISDIDADVATKAPITIMPCPVMIAVTKHKAATHAPANSFTGRI